MPVFHVVAVHSDQSCERVGGEHDKLEAACRDAFRIADAAGQTGWWEGAQTPSWIAVYSGQRLELSIQVDT